MRPGRALILAALAEFLGPLLLGTAVARTMAGSILRPELLEGLSKEQVYLIVISAVGGAIIWKLPTWSVGLPSSGSHALISGLVGAGFVAMGKTGIAIDAVVNSVVLPLLVSPFVGMLLGFFVFSLIGVLFGRAHRSVAGFFAVAQNPTMLFLAASHGSNDAQKSMGVIALVLAAGSGEIHGELEIPYWVVVSCAAALACGLGAGGRRIAKTVGYGICRLEPVHSFASHLAATSVVMAASLAGGPVSTAQVVTASVMGVGASRRLSGVRWSSAANIAYAWFMTVPLSAILGAVLYWGLASSLGQ